MFLNTINIDEKENSYTIDNKDLAQMGIPLILYIDYPKLLLNDVSYGGVMRNHFFQKVIMILTLFLGYMFVLAGEVFSAIVADHIAVSEFTSIPDSIIEAVNDSFNIYYVHTSHGSQIMTGIAMVYEENSLYASPYFREVSDDLGHNGDTSWVPATRLYFSQHPECNMAMFSWCGGCSDNTEEGIDIYLNKMNELEDDFPDVTFIYMTGHLDGSGPEGNLYLRNNQIRAYCIANNKILFDFADIESYDPDGTYYPDESDACYWCYDWCSIHTCPGCASCAHSHCFNCYLKGKGWWWMMAKILGWNPGDYYCADINGDAQINIYDISYLIDYLYSGGPPPVPPADGNLNDDGDINIFDITYLIAYLYMGASPPICP